jgi:hypothetical protein
MNKATVGSHTLRPLAKNDNYKTHVYIIPMCSKHNGKHGKQLKVKQNTTFVYANVSKTCGNRS